MWVEGDEINKNVDLRHATNLAKVVLSSNAINLISTLRFVVERLYFPSFLRVIIRYIISQDPQPQLKPSK